MKSKSIYFPGLNGIRFIAASAVIITHIESFKYKSALPNLHKFSDFLGTQGVNIFFALSGFLITYLLLEEIKQKGSVKIKNFYVRRILRIWPLYFLILILGFFVFPEFWYPIFFEKPNDSQFGTKLFLNTFFLPNLVLYTFGSYFTTGILWSIGVEEQFYIIWPWFIRRWQSLKGILKFLVLYFLLRYGIYILSLLSLSDAVHSFFEISYLFLQHDSILIGGLIAYIFHSKNQILNPLYSKKTQAAAITIPILLLLIYKISGLNWIHLVSPILSFCYSIIILNVSTNKDSILKLETKLLNYLGKISFGLYMYHSILIFGVMSIYTYYNINYSVPNQIIFYVLVFGSTVFTASISYKYFEKPLLKYKSTFMSIKSSSSKT